ncbi:zf-C2H2 domain-containing protein [Rhizoctonia solani AG-1 IA]|uniref:Zf-C2H2 domain-containing protein n=1 Tax=Thanatephorus cucumeris (strain AG1-IA) TaxID=983506 RepID=L8X0G5_THACA|nr:zf-C2H2 domain-containing protein [Rhizoctonia solani AG-1 IA]
MASTSASPPPQYIATGQPPDGTEWGDVPRLPPILQVEKQHVTTTATQAASASRRRNDAQFKCPVPGCGSTFTRRFNLRGHLRSHTEERPFVCEWPGCTKGFARQHDCKRHYALHNAKPNQHLCEGCGKTFSRTDALNLRSDGGSGCRKSVAAKAGPSTSNPPPPPPPVPVSDPAEGHPPPPPGTLNGHYPISLAVNGPPQPGAPADPNLHHIHPHQLPPELNPQFLAGLLSGQQFLAAAAAANDPNHPPPPPQPHVYDGIIQAVSAPPQPQPESEPPVPAEEESSEPPSKRRAVSAGSEIVSVPVPGSGAESSEPPREPTTKENESTHRTRHSAALGATLVSGSKSASKKIISYIQSVLFYSPAWEFFTPLAPPKSTTQKLTVIYKPMTPKLGSGKGGAQHQASHRVGLCLHNASRMISHDSAIAGLSGAYSQTPPERLYNLFYPGFSINDWARITQDGSTDAHEWGRRVRPVECATGVFEAIRPRSRCGTQ